MTFQAALCLFISSLFRLPENNYFLNFLFKKRFFNLVVLIQILSGSLKKTKKQVFLDFEKKTLSGSLNTYSISLSWLYDKIPVFDFAAHHKKGNHDTTIPFLSFLILCIDGHMCLICLPNCSHFWPQHEPSINAEKSIQYTAT